MKRFLISLSAIMIILLAATMVMAEDKMAKDKACALLGDCGNDMVATAKAMQVECEKMMEKAKVLIDKGKMIRGQGKLWDDAEMEADGTKIYEDGKTMLAKAEEMHNTCALIITAGENTKKKWFGKSNKKGDSKEPASQGDHSPM